MELLVVGIYAAVPAVLIIVTIGWFRERRRKGRPGSPPPGA
jgi:hypothetical protein